MTTGKTTARIRFGNWLWERVLRPRLFGKEAEASHLFAVRSLVELQKMEMLWILKLLFRSPFYNLMPVKVFGSTWRNPVGLAAGFDKNGECVPALKALGFGSAEIGTVTPRPQRGNKQPRLFRNPEKLAVLNRYGFNSEEIDAVARRLTSPTVFRVRRGFPIGISIGRNAKTSDKDAILDYLVAFSSVLLALIPNQDWVKINISSPNTQGLRAIFERLDDFLGEFVCEAKKIAGESRLWFPPLVLKVPPDDLTEVGYQRIVGICSKYGIGIEGTNTTVDAIVKARCGWKDEAGGVSGDPLRARANRVLEHMSDAAASGNVDIVAVGGIVEGRHIPEKRQIGGPQVKGAQIYTGLVFRGPGLIHDCLTYWK